MILIEITVKGHVMWYQPLFSFKGKLCLAPLPPHTYFQLTQVAHTTALAPMEEGGQRDSGQSVVTRGSLQRVPLFQQKGNLRPPGLPSRKVVLIVC